jgi:hypothetical protein
MKAMVDDTAIVTAIALNLAYTLLTVIAKITRYTSICSAIFAVSPVWFRPSLCTAGIM